MSITKKQILDAIAEMSVMDIVELVSMIEEKFGVIASSIAPVSGTIAANPAELIEEKTEFDVMLTAIGTNKISVIKIVRGVTGLGLKESKDLVESTPVLLKQGINKETAQSLKNTLEEAGASVEVK